VRNVATDHTQVVLDWNVLESGLPIGFKEVLGYKLYWDANGSFEERITLNDALITSYTETNVVQGTMY
jgi:hypothetical protein